MRLVSSDKFNRWLWKRRDALSFVFLRLSFKTGVSTDSKNRRRKASVAKCRETVSMARDWLAAVRCLPIQFKPISQQQGIKTQGLHLLPFLRCRSGLSLHKTRKNSAKAMPTITGSLWQASSWSFKWWHLLDRWIRSENSLWADCVEQMIRWQHEMFLVLRCKWKAIYNPKHWGSYRFFISSQTKPALGGSSCGKCSLALNMRSAFWFFQFRKCKTISRETNVAAENHRKRFPD